MGRAAGKREPSLESLCLAQGRGGEAAEEAADLSTAVSGGEDRMLQETNLE